MAARKLPKGRPTDAYARPISDDRLAKVTVKMRRSAHVKLKHISVESGQDLGTIVSDLVEREYGGSYWVQRSARPPSPTPEPPADGPADEPGPRLAEAS